MCVCVCAVCVCEQCDCVRACVRVLVARARVGGVYVKVCMNEDKMPSIAYLKWCSLSLMTHHGYACFSCPQARASIYNFPVFGPLLKAITYVRRDMLSK